MNNTRIVPAVFGAALCANALADNWDNSAGNALWATASNWVDNTVPTINDFALFPNTIPGGQSIITCPTNTFALSLNFLNSYTLIGGNIQLGNGTISASGWSPIIRSHLTGTGPFTFNGGTINVLPISGNSYTGGTIISGSNTTVVVTTNGALGLSTAPITLNGGRLRLDGETFNPPFIMLRDITLGTGGGTIDLINNAFLDLNRPFAATANLLTLTGTGSAEFNSTTTRSGNTTVNGPFVRMNNAQALGTGTINVFGTGVLELANGQTYTMPTGLGTGATLQGGAGTNTYNGSCNVFGTNVTLSSGPLTTDLLSLGTNGASVWNGSGTTQVSGGTVRLNSANNYTGNWLIQGILQADHTNSLGTGTTAIDVSGSGRLRLNAPLLARDITLNNPGGGLELLQDATIFGDITIPSTSSYVPVVGSDHELTLAFDGSSVTYGGTAFFGGASGVGSFRVSAGADVSGRDTRLHGVAGGPGRITVSGAGSTWTNTNEMWIGNNLSPPTEGQLIVEAGGAVSCPGIYVGVVGPGTATVTGEGSSLTSTTFLKVGLASQSLMSVLAGADVSAQETYVGEGISASGALIVDGAGSTWTNQGLLKVGKSEPTSTAPASGVVTLTNGSALSCLGLQLGDGATGSGALTITGGVTALDVGSVGVLMCQNGAAGTLNLFGGIVDIQGNITDAGPGVSTFVLDGATLDMHNAAIGGASPIDNLEFKSGTLKNVMEINSGAGLTKTGPGTLYLNTSNSYSGTTQVNEGTLFVVNSAGSATGIGPVLVPPNATLAGPGQIDGPLNSNGHVSPEGFASDPIGTLTVVNNYNQSLGGTFHIDVGGASQFDRLVLTNGAATLDGTLNVNLLNGFVPAAGDAFEIVAASSVNGTFASENLPSLPSLLVWQIEYLPTAVRLNVVSSGIPGDVDGDGQVGLLDLTLLLSSFGACTGDAGYLEAADFNGDGCIDLADLTTLLGNFGA